MYLPAGGSPHYTESEPQRNKAKDKEKDYKKKENREEGFESKGKKGRKQKPTVEVQRPQPKPEVKKGVDFIERISTPPFADLNLPSFDIIIKEIETNPENSGNI